MILMSVGCARMSNVSDVSMCESECMSDVSDASECVTCESECMSEWCE